MSSIGDQQDHQDGPAEHGEAGLQHRASARPLHELGRETFGGASVPENRRRSSADSMTAQRFHTQTMAHPRNLLAEITALQA